MTTFLMLSTLGPDGAATLRQNPGRTREVNAEVEAMGVKILHQWAVLGQYDFCTILEAPDEMTVAKVAVTLGARGTLKTLTLTAIPVEEFLSAIGETEPGPAAQYHQSP
ncbi:MAG: GYD domain-containing protein [Actinobacteria bacterium]|nr:GYD domain-containing protein [Actinomycetota bacterium]